MSINNYVLIYEYALSFLRKMMDENSVLRNVQINEYFIADSNMDTLEIVTRSLFKTLKNRNMMRSVVNYTGKEDIVEKLFYNYNMKMICQHWDAEALFQEFRKHFNINNYESPQNLWRQYAKSIVSASCYFSQFHDIKKLRDYFDSFQISTESKVKLPTTLANNIYGMGFALACDFLKEIGYDYAKPDVHIKDIFYNLGLSAKDDLQAYKRVVEIADINKTSVYSVDKILWLICSGDFYKHNVKLIGRKADFINELKKKLSK